MSLDREDPAVTDQEVIRAQFVAARELVMAHLTEITLDRPGDATEAMQAWQLADLTLIMTKAATTIAHEAVTAWADSTGRSTADVLQELAVRVAAKH